MDTRKADRWWTGKDRPLAEPPEEDISFAPSYWRGRQSTDVMTGPDQHTVQIRTTPSTTTGYVVQPVDGLHWACTVLPTETSARPAIAAITERLVGTLTTSRASTPVDDLLGFSHDDTPRLAPEESAPRAPAYRCTGIAVSPRDVWAILRPRK